MKNRKTGRKIIYEIPYAELMKRYKTAQTPSPMIVKDIVCAVGIFDWSEYTDLVTSRVKELTEEMLKSRYWTENWTILGIGPDKVNYYKPVDQEEPKIGGLDMSSQKVPKSEIQEEESCPEMAMGYTDSCMNCTDHNFPCLPNNLADWRPG